MRSRDDSPVPIRAYHAIFGAYGFWLPNDPRGSWSTFVASWELYRYGAATKTDSRRSVAKARHDHRARLEAKSALRYPPVSFTGQQALAIAAGFRQMAAKADYVIHACAILPDHVHLVIARHRYSIEQVVRLLKAEASRRLAEMRQHPFANCPLTDGTLPTPWARRGWNVYLHTDEEIRRAIRYVELNPIKERKRPLR